MRTSYKVGIQIIMLAAIIAGALFEVTPIFNLVKYGTVVFVVAAILFLAGRVSSREYEWATSKPLSRHSTIFFILAATTLVMTGHFILATFWIFTGIINLAAMGYNKKLNGGKL